MLKIIAIALALAFTAAAQAAGPTCNAAVAEKKLAGAAKTSFLKKCTADAKATCEGAQRRSPK